MMYKGYTAKIEFDDEANLFHGQVLNLRDVITFQGQSVEELQREFAASVDDYLAFCAERGEEPEKPFSGRFVIRIEPALHRDIAIVASRAGKSINAWVTEVFQRAIQSRSAEPQVSGHRFTQQVRSRHYDFDVIVSQLQVTEQSLPGIGRQSTMLVRSETATAARGRVVLPELDSSPSELVYLVEKDPINAA